MPDWLGFRNFLFLVFVIGLTAVVFFHPGSLIVVGVLGVFICYFFLIRTKRAVYSTSIGLSLLGTLSTLSQNLSEKESDLQALTQALEAIGLSAKAKTVAIFQNSPSSLEKPKLVHQWTRDHSDAKVKQTPPHRIPIYIDGAAWGSLSLEFAQTLRWSKEETKVLEMTASFLGDLIKQISLRGELRQTQELFREEYIKSIYQGHLLKTLVDIGQINLGWNETESIEEEVLARLGKAVGADRVSVSEFLIHTDGEQVSYTYSDHFEWRAAVLMDSPVPYRQQNLEGLSPWISPLLEGEVVQIQSPHYTSDLPQLNQLRMRSIVVVPLEISGTIWGGIGFANQSERIWSEEEIALLKTSAALLGGMLERNRQMVELHKSSLVHRKLYQESQYLSQLLQSVVLMSQAGYESNSSLIEQEILPHLGLTIGVDRVYINRFYTHPKLGSVYGVEQEWCRETVLAQFPKPNCKVVPTYEPWLKALEMGKPFKAVASEFPPQRRYLASEEGIKSILLVPITVSNALWGSLGLDDCVDERVWSAQEIGVLQTAAAQIGGIIERQKAFGALSEREKENREQARQLELLLKFRQALTLDLEPEQAVRRSVELVAETFGYNLVSIYLRNQDALVLQSQVGYQQWLERVPIGEGIVSRCIYSGEAILIEDAAADPQFLFAMQGIRSSVTIPLKVEGQTVGILNIESMELSLGMSDLYLLQSIGVQIGLILERSRAIEQLVEGKKSINRLLGQTQEQAHRLELLLKLRDALMVEKETEHVLGRFIEEVQYRFGFDLAAVYLLEGDRLVAKYWSGYDLTNTSIPLGKGLTSRCVLTAQPIWLDDPAQDPDFLVEFEQVLSAIYVPIQVAGKVIGSFNIESQDRKFSGTDFELIKSVVDQLNLILERNQAFTELTESETRFRTLVERIPDAIWLMDPQTLDIRYANHSAVRLLGGSQTSDLVGRSMKDFWLPENYQRNCERVHQLLNNSTELPIIEQVLRKLDGELIEIESTAVRISSNQHTYGVSIFRDIGERKAVQRKIESLAYYDGLTGLPNKAALVERANETLHPSGKATLLYFNINDLKIINDAYGHPMGDALLKQVANRLEQQFSADSLVARVGGDEFALLNFMQDPDELVAQLHSLLSQPFEVLGNELRITIGVGMSVFPQHGPSIENLLHGAEAALSQAKLAGSTYALYQPELDQKMRDRLDLLQDLRRALELGEIVPFYQPIVNLHDGKWEKLEVLSRWFHPKRGFISPELFIELAESSGLIRQLDRHIFLTAVNQLGHAPLDLSINVSPKTLLDDHFVPWVKENLHKKGINPQRIWLEITEALMLDNPALACTRLEELRALGIQVSLDDFGSGYSSMAYLKDLPVDLVKIDRKFIWDIGKSQRAENILQGMIGLSKSLGLPVLAEGIETLEQSQWLLEAGCRFGQGYFYSRPISYAQLNSQPEFASIPACTILVSIST